MHSFPFWKWKCCTHVCRYVSVAQKHRIAKGLPFSLLEISHNSLSSRTTAVTLHFGRAVVFTEGEPRSGIALHRHTMWGIMPLINPAIQERAQNKIWQECPNLTQEEVSVRCLLPWAALWRLKLNPQPWMKSTGLALSTLLGMKLQGFAAGEHWKNKTKRVSFAKAFKKKKDSLRGTVYGAATPCLHINKNLAAPKKTEISKTVCLTYTFQKRIVEIVKTRVTLKKMFAVYY